jgi:hypothetical protein
MPTWCATTGPPILGRRLYPLSPRLDQNMDPCSHLVLFLFLR